MKKSLLFLLFAWSIFTLNGCGSGSPTPPPSVTHFSGTHAFRHAAASELLEEGAPLTVVQRQLRDGEAKTTLQKYGHVVVDSQRRAVNSLAEKIERQAVELESGAELSSVNLQRAMGIEPTSKAWEARNKILKTLELAALSKLEVGLNWKMGGK